MASEQGILYVLSGASGCGKTTLLNSIAAEDIERADPVLRAVRAPKYSERPQRKEAEAPDDITTLGAINSQTVDIPYLINNVRYGVRIEPIREILQRGLNGFIILSDFKVVRRLLAEFPEQSRAIYISSAIDAARLRRIQAERLGWRPDVEQQRILAYHFARLAAASRLGWWDRVSDCVSELDRDWREYATDSGSTEVRAQRIRAFHTRYIDHLALFDHVVLNYNEAAPEEMTRQMSSLLAAPGFRRSTWVWPPIFVVAAASGAGKGTMMEMLNLIGRDRIQISSKVADRKAKPDKDRIDGMVAIGGASDEKHPEWPAWWTEDMIQQAVRQEIPTAYDLSWEFHAGTRYAVATSEINRNLEAGSPQLFVSNMGEFERFRELWPEHVRFVYLHRLSTAEENRRFQLDKWEDDPEEAGVRIREREAVHGQYLERIAEFHHVILNTSFREDMFDQVANLVDFYAMEAAGVA